MTENRRFLPLCLASGLLLVLPQVGGAAAAEREHGAHEHGVGQLNVAVEGETVEIELVAPGADIVGFEHAAETDEDKKAMEAALAALKEGEAIFVFPAEAACRLEEVEAENEALGHDEHDDHGHDDDGHDDHGHDDHAGEEHKEGEHDEHAHEEHAHDEHEEHGEESHSEFHAHYHFDCEKPDAVTHVDVTYFERFPAAEELDAQVIGESGQSAQELTAEATRLDL